MLWLAQIPKSQPQPLTPGSEKHKGGLPQGLGHHLPGQISAYTAHPLPPYSHLRITPREKLSIGEPTQVYGVEQGGRGEWGEVVGGREGCPSLYLKRAASPWDSLFLLRARLHFLPRGHQAKLSRPPEHRHLCRPRRIMETPPANHAEKQGQARQEERGAPFPWQAGDLEGRPGGQRLGRTAEAGRVGLQAEGGWGGAGRAGSHRPRDPPPGQPLRVSGL